jgi:hypothetical protein
MSRTEDLRRRRARDAAFDDIYARKHVEAEIIDMLRTLKRRNQGRTRDQIDAELSRRFKDEEEVFKTPYAAEHVDDAIDCLRSEGLIRFVPNAGIVLKWQLTW